MDTVALEPFEMTPLGQNSFGFFSRPMLTDSNNTATQPELQQTNVFANPLVWVVGPLAFVLLIYGIYQIIQSLRSQHEKQDAKNKASHTQKRT